MSDFSDLYANIAARYKDWLSDQDNDGGNVTDNALDTLNRAQKNLWRYRPWQYAIKRATLTIASNAATLPTDFGRIVRMYRDADGDGKPDFYYYLEGKYDTGYKIVDTFAKATGHSFVVTFYTTPPSTVYLEYVANLSEFAGTGTEYSFFPGDLLLIEAQYIHIVDSGLVGGDYQTLATRRAEVLRDYEQAHQYRNTDIRVQHNDMYGNEIVQETNSLDGDISGGNGRHARDFDDGTL